MTHQLTRTAAFYVSSVVLIKVFNLVVNINWTSYFFIKAKGELKFDKTKDNLQIKLGVKVQKSLYQCNKGCKQT